MARNDRRADRDITLTAPDGRQATFGPMPAGDAALVAVIATAKGHTAAAEPSRAR